MTKTGIVLIDIETSFMLMPVFGLKYNDYMDHNNIIQDWQIYCAAWKYLDIDGVNSISVNPFNIKDDYNVCLQLRNVLCDAKMVIYHNGDKFDLKKLNARLIKHGIEPIDHKLLTLDTYKMAKKHFGFTSNKLDYIAKYLNVGEKLSHREGNPWLSLITNKNVRSTLKHMVEYCKYDVHPLLEGVYLKMRPYIDHPNLADKGSALGLYMCTHCGSQKVTKQGSRKTRTGIDRQRWQCQSCGGWGNTKLEKAGE